MFALPLRAAVLLLALLAGLLSPSAHAAASLLSFKRPTYASSVEGNNTADLAVDGTTGSRWASVWGVDPQWLYVDLGATAQVSRVKIQWEGAYAKAYKVQISSDEYTWTDLYSTTTGAGGTNDLTLSGSGRYVRVLGTQRALAAYGYSILELEVYGTGGVTPPVQYGPNVALNKAASASSYQTNPPSGTAVPANAVDGNPSTRWSSNATDSEWFTVDLGSSRTLGRIVLNWETAAGRVYDIQISSNGTQWTTVYRELHGQAGVQTLPVYATGRYVRVQGYGRATGFGYSLYELEAYDYVAGEPQPTYTIAPLPVASKVQVGSGSYLTNDYKMPQPLYPGNRASTLKTPLPSNDWWQSLLVKNPGDYLVTLPLKSKFFSQGLGILNPGAGWINGDGSAVNADGNPDLYLGSNTLDTSKLVNRVAGYGDWSVDAVLSDDATDKVKVTLVKGSPYLYTQFADPNSVEIYSSVLTQIFNDSNVAILTTDGASVTADHIGLRISNTDSGPSGTVYTRYYGVFAPAGTVFQKVGSKIKIKLGSSQNFLSVAALPSATDLNYFYQHGYAFVTGTQVSYAYDETSAQLTSTFTLATQLKRTGFSALPVTTLLPHQWKSSTAALTALTYPSVRGTLKAREGTSFTTVNRFHGIVPQFPEPTNGEYSRTMMTQYLQTLDQQTASTPMAADAYWQGKQLHPLAMGVLAADKMGNTASRDVFLSRLRTMLTNWYTYTDGEPDYFFYYNPDWGTTYYKTSEFGANTGITDHHFTYGYFVFASAVLASYDATFRTQYGGMVEHLIRDYANPSRTDTMYPFFRNFDPYEGHSWAGGYADNNNGNNQEAAGEALFGWVGEYLWGVLTGNTAYRDAGIFGFTTELKAVQQYWFNYDGDNWVAAYKHKTVGQVYGTSNFYGTFFSGAPVHIYGIHWLPTGEYLTSYGFNATQVGALYNGFVTDNGGPETTWQHVVWPIQSLSNAPAVISKWNGTLPQQNEVFNTYWFVHNLASLGQRTTDIWATGKAAATVYKKGTVYSALVWNPTDAALTVTFKNASGTTGTASVPAKALVRVNPVN